MNTSSSNKKIPAEKLALLFRIREVQFSTQRPDVPPEEFRGFPQLLQAKCRFLPHVSLFNIH
jgi:hypothetical protein